MCWREDPCGMACIQAALLRSVGFKEGWVQVFIEWMEKPFVYSLSWYPASLPSGLFDPQLSYSQLWGCVVTPSSSYSNRLPASLPKGVREIRCFLMRSRWFLEILLMRLYSIKPPGPLQGSHSLYPESGPWES